jgi:hypothetical protein
MVSDRNEKGRQSPQEARHGVAMARGTVHPRTAPERGSGALSGSACRTRSQGEGGPPTPEQSLQSARPAHERVSRSPEPR